MKKKVSVLMLALLCSSLAWTQQPDVVVSAIDHSDMQTLCTAFTNRVEVTLPDAEGMVDNAMACKMLTAFFDQHTVQSFKVMHQGNSSGATFVVGVLHTNKGDFRLNALFRKDTAKQMRVEQIRIERP